VLYLAQLYSDLQPPNAEPLSIEVLEAALRDRIPQSEVRLAVVNPAVAANAARDFVDEVKIAHAELVGLSVPQGTFGLALQILSRLTILQTPSWKPTVILGHAIPTYAPEALLSLFPNVVIVKGCGESALLGLVRRLWDGSRRWTRGADSCGRSGDSCEFKWTGRASSWQGLRGRTLSSNLLKTKQSEQRRMGAESRKCRLPGDHEDEDLADTSHARRSGIIGRHRVERAKIWRRLSGICEKVRRLGEMDHHYVEQNPWQELRESAAPVAYESTITARAGN
jgi:hypothetical protein